MAEAIPARLSRREARQFGLLVGAAFLVLGAVAWWRGRTTTALSFAGVGATLLIFGLVLPDLLGPVRRAWMGMAGMISRVTTPIFLGLVYFGLFTTVGMIRRLAGHNALKPRLVNDSYWVARDTPGNRPEDMDHQF